jgi:hypothetical protein
MHSLLFFFFFFLLFSLYFSVLRMVYREFQQRYSLVLRSHHWQEISACRSKEDLGEGEKENVCGSDRLEQLLRQQLNFPMSPHKTQTPKKKLRRRTGE